MLVSKVSKRGDAMQYILLWLIGLPIPILLLLWFYFR